MTNRIGGPTLPSGFVALGIIVMLVFAVIAVRVGSVLGGDSTSASVVVPLETDRLVVGESVTLDLPRTDGRILVTVTPPAVLDLSALPGDGSGAAVIEDCRSGCRLVLGIVRSLGPTEAAAILIEYEAADAVDLDAIRPVGG